VETFYLVGQLKLFSHFMTDEQKSEIIKRCENAIANKHRVRIGDIVTEVMGSEQKRSLLKTIALALEETGKYKYEIDERKPNDYEVRYNPNYKEPSWSDLHPVKDKIRTGAITALFSLIVGIALYLITRPTNTQRENLQDKRLDGLSDSIATFQKHLTDSTKHFTN
jgi:hypothetical protein